MKRTAFFVLLFALALSAFAAKVDLPTFTVTPGIQGFTLDATTTPSTAYALLIAVDAGGTTRTATAKAHTTTGTLTAKISGLSPVDAAFDPAKYKLLVYVNTVPSLGTATLVTLGTFSVRDSLAEITISRASLIYFFTRALAHGANAGALLQAVNDTATFNGSNRQGDALRAYRDRAAQISKEGVQ